MEPEVFYSEVTSTVLKTLHNQSIGELSINQIAMEMNRNVNHIIRCFKREIGITPHKYISMMKTDLAISYIRQGLSCTEIAESLGFGSLSAFSYFFKKETNKNLTDFK